MKEQLLYLECFSGISGDMSVGALLDLGADSEVLRQALDSLHVDGYHIHIGRTQKCGIDACSFDVILDHEHHHHHEHTHEHHHEHHDHTHEHHHHHEHRNISDIQGIIAQSDLTQRAKDLANHIFGYVARAEAIAHGLPIQEVHFHEVGAIDSIVDIVAVAVCIDNLNIQKVAVSTIYEGQGYVKCQHGVIPVPVPAVVNIAKEANMALRITDNRGEMVTPTGMAIAAALKTESSLPESYTIVNIGLGAGKKDFKQANLLRAMIIEADVAPETIWTLETNVDDCSGEALSFTMEELLKKGANDVFFTSIYMKKNRPATLLTVLCQQGDILLMEDILFIHLTTIGIRRYPCHRTVLPRTIQTLDTSYGKITFKICTHKGKTVAYPEYEDVKALCLAQNLPFDQTYHQLKAQGNAKLW